MNDTRDLPRGTVTFLFTDIEGSTRLLGELGPGAYGDALDEHRRLLRDVFTRHGGVEVDTQGDAFFVAFAEPAAALCAADEAQRALASGPVRARMGVHTGTPHLAGESYVGEDVHLGARITAAGHGGQVLLSKQTAELVDAALSDLGEHRVKDFAEPIWLFQLGSDRFPPLRTISNTNLPRPASTFIGREAEVEQIGALLRDGARLVTLTGPGGCGKTRLAIETAAELIPTQRNGVFWVGLAALADHRLVVPQVAQTLGAKEELAAHVGDRQMLLVLDNFEQVVDSAPEVSSLLAACPELRVLVTSRQRLRINGEVEYTVPPLAPRESVELFTTRSGLPADGTISELCNRLDNLPLAVELAAARTSVLTPAQILQRISKRLDLLKGGRDTEVRQRTLRATIEWSHDLLTSDEDALFRRLAVFRGGYTLESAEHVAGADLDTLESLVDQSLVRHTGDRFWMLETIREFAAEKLAESTDADPLAARHAEYFLALGEAAEPHLLARDADTWHERLGIEHGNLRAALDHFESTGEIEQAMRLAGAIAEFWDQRTHQQEGLRRYRSLLDADERGTAARAKALNGASMMATICGDLPLGRRWAEEALVLHRSFGDDSGTAISLWQLGYVSLEEGDPGAAEELLTRAVELLRVAGDEANLRWATRTLAFTYNTMGDLQRARPLYEENLERSRESGDRALEAATLGGLSSIALGEDRLADAVEIERKSLDLVIHINDELMALSRLCNAAKVLAAVGRAEAAAKLIGYADSRYQETGTSEPWVVRMNEKTTASVRRQIDEPALAAARAEGARLTPHNALQLAVAEMAAAAEDLRR